MTAGVPGLGLSGLFVLISALTLPLARRQHRHQPQQPNTRIARLFWMAVVMAAGIILTWEAIVLIITAATAHSAGHTRSVTSAALAGHGFWRLPVIAISASIMVLLIATAEALLHLIGTKPTPTPPPITPDLPFRDHEPTLRIHLHQDRDSASRAQSTETDNVAIPVDRNLF